MLEDYTKAVEYLEKYIPDPKHKHLGELGLRRMEYLMKLLGNPQLDYPTIHVGGTSGKGSTATMTASILGTKYKTGLYTSPHLAEVRERIVLINPKSQIPKLKKIPNSKIQIQNNNNQLITKIEFVSLMNLLKPVIDKMKESIYGAPSYFEIVTAMAFIYFKIRKVGVAVIEVGMGGRYDGTNVVKPLVSVITNIGLDHTEVLGDTVEKIAGDKAGIIKRGIEVVTGAGNISIVKMLNAQCSILNARISIINRDFSYKVRDISLEESRFDYKGDGEYRDLRIMLIGKHQMENAAMAVRVIELMNRYQISDIRYQGKDNINEENIRKGLLRAFIPGRFQIINHSPLIIIDGAHNQDKMEALTDTIKILFPGKKVKLILAVKTGKDARIMIEKLIDIAHTFILCRYKSINDTGSVISYAPSDLKMIVKSIDKAVTVKIIKDPETAFRSVIAESEKDEIILVTGSLYLIGSLLKILTYE